LLRDKEQAFDTNPSKPRKIKVLTGLILMFILLASLALGAGFYAKNLPQLLFLLVNVAVGLCPTPRFLFGVQKGTEKDSARLRRFLIFLFLQKNFLFTHYFF